MILSALSGRDFSTTGANVAFSAIEWLESVSEAVRTVKADEALEEQRRELVLGGGATLHDVMVSQTPDMDVMRPVDALIEYAEGRCRRVSAAQSEIMDAMRVFEGMRAVGPMEARAADVFELCYVHLMSRRNVAQKMCISPTTLQTVSAYGVDWLNSHGLAHAKAATGRAEA